MSQVAADLAAAEAVRRHHTQLAKGLDDRVETLLRAVDHQYLLKADQARLDLLDYLRRELVPHAHAEERALYPAAAAQPEGEPLIAGMLEEHRVLTGLVDELAGAPSPVRAAGAARALAVLFATHLAKENNLLLPLIVDAAQVSLAGLLSGMHRQLVESAARD
jgi:hypothetical protein